MKGVFSGKTVSLALSKLQADFHETRKGRILHQDTAMYGADSNSILIVYIYLFRYQEIKWALAMGTFPFCEVASKFQTHSDSLVNLCKYASLWMWPPIL